MVAVKPLRDAGVDLDMMTLLDILDLRGYRDAKRAINDPNIKIESVPVHWQKTVMGVKRKQLLRARERAASRKRRQQRNERGAG